MLRRGLRRILSLALLVSVALTLYAVARIWADPALSPYRDATADEIGAALDRHLADLAPNAIPDRIAVRLAEEPRNWIALDALDTLAQERGQTLPPDLRAAFDAARAEDSGFFANAANCAACAYDPAACSLSNVFLCHAPIALTPIGDMAAITRGAIAHMAGEEVDRIDLTLAIVGLGATVTVVASGGTSLVAKAGASGLKLARNMGRLSPSLNATLVRAATEGVDWMALRRAGSLDDIAASLRAEAFAPVVGIAADLERLRAATDTTTALHLLPLVDDATDATRLARAAEALGPRITARAEVLGKARLLRATVRLTDTALTLIGGLLGLLLSGAVLLANALQTRIFAALRRAAIRAENAP